MNKLSIFIISLILFSTGCSINHPVAKDYQAHLEKTQSDITLPKTPVKAAYAIEEATQTHRYEFRAATVGYAHLWIVEFGDILDKTLQADYVQSAFGRLDKTSLDLREKGKSITFDLRSFEFKNYKAYTTMNIKVSKDSQLILNKSYTAQGSSQGGKMWAAGPFGMKGATLQSTKQSIDSILKQFINDLNAVKE